MAFSANNMSLEERFGALDEEKARFVSKVYSGLTLSLVVATLTCILGLQWFGSMSPGQMRSTSSMLSFGLLGMVLVGMFVRMRGVFGWVFLMTFVSLTGVVLAPILMMYQKLAGTGTIAAALGLTAGIFLTLSAYVRYSGKDFSFLGGFLWMATVGLILTGLLFMFFPASGMISYAYSCVGALIFCGWILYDTSAVTRQYYRDDNVVGAVLNLYLDILNLFLYLLQILGRSRD